jgi:hypothetical protein
VEALSTVAAAVPEQPHFEPFVDADKAAEFLSMDRETIIRWARACKIPAHPLGTGGRRVWRFRLSELSLWAEGKLQLRHRPCSSKKGIQ